MDGIWNGNQFNSSIQLNTWDLATDFDCIPHSSQRFSLFKSKNGLNRSGTENCTFMPYDTILIRDFIQFSGIRYGPEFVCVYFFILFSLSLRSVSFFLCFCLNDPLICSNRVAYNTHRSSDREKRNRKKRERTHIKHRHNVNNKIVDVFESKTHGNQAHSTFAALRI